MDLCPQVDSQVCSKVNGRYSKGLIQLYLHKFHTEHPSLSSHCAVSPFKSRWYLTYRNYLVLLIANNTPIGYKDILCVAALIASIGLETLADEQQWTYQNAKHASPSHSTRSRAKTTSASASYCTPMDLKRGFITGGLFRYSRHPNFACEQANWYFFYAFGCIATVHPVYIILILTRSERYGIGLLLGLWRSRLWYLWYFAGNGVGWWLGVDHSDWVDYYTEISVWPCGDWLLIVVVSIEYIRRRLGNLFHCLDIFGNRMAALMERGWIEF